MSLMQYGSADMVRRVVRPDVLAMAAYTVQDASGLLKMDAMENPHRLPQALQDELGRRLGSVALNRYPGPQLEKLRTALQAHGDVPPGCALMMGNGSDELISLLAMACSKPGASVLAPEPGFVMYGMSARLQGLAYHGVPLRDDFELDEIAMLEAMRRQHPTIVYLACPNNPTANCWNEAVMERIIVAAPGLVVVDEAYQPFAQRSFMARLPRHPNLLVMRTMSKFGLAGVRIGFLAGCSELVAQIDKVRPPYNISALNAECCLFALEHADEFALQAQDIITQREILLRRLGAMAGLQTFRSDANMVLVRVPAGSASRVFAGMKAAGVLVKNVSGMHAVLRDCLRLTVGTGAENETMLQALKESL